MIFRWGVYVNIWRKCLISFPTHSIFKGFSIISAKVFKVVCLLLITSLLHSNIFFVSGFSLHRHWRFTGLSSLPLPSGHKHSDTYLQLWMWDNYHVFLVASLVFTRLLLDGIYHPTASTFNWLMMQCLFAYWMIYF